jgi:CubicO group peptidase (beta-lactamase class C family)
MKQICVYFIWVAGLALSIFGSFAFAGCGDDSSSADADAGGDSDSDSDSDSDGDSDSDTDTDTDSDSDSDSDTDSDETCADLDNKFNALVTQFESWLTTDKNVSGGALAVVCGGEIRTAGVGKVKAGGADVTSATLFQMASITKMFTAASAVTLAAAADPVIDLAAPVSDIAPSLGYGEITLDQILSHSAGFFMMFLNEESYMGFVDWFIDF